MRRGVRARRVERPIKNAETCSSAAPRLCARGRRAQPHDLLRRRQVLTAAAAVAPLLAEGSPAIPVANARGLCGVCSRVAALRLDLRSRRRRCRRGVGCVGCVCGGRPRSARRHGSPRRRIPPRRLAAAAARRFRAASARKRLCPVAGACECGCAHDANDARCCHLPSRRPRDVGELIRPQIDLQVCRWPHRQVRTLGEACRLRLWQ